MGYRPSLTLCLSFSWYSPSRSLSRSVAPHAYRGRISRPARVALCELGSRTLSIEERPKQVLERELTCLSPSRTPFHSRAFQGKPLSPIFLDQNKSCGRIQLCVRGHTAACFDVRQLGHRGFRMSRAPVAFSQNISQTRMAFRARFTFRETRLRRFSHPRGLLGTPSSSHRRRRVSNRRRNHFHNYMAALWQTWEKGDQRYGTKSSLRSRKLRGALFNVCRTRDDWLIKKHTEMLKRAHDIG